MTGQVVEVANGLVIWSFLPRDAPFQHKITIRNTMNYHTGWWYTYPSEKYEFVSWDYEIPN